MELLKKGANILTCACSESCSSATDVPADSTSPKATVPAAVSSSRSGSLDLPEAFWDPARKAIVRNLLGYLPDAPVVAKPQISQSTPHDLKPVVALFSATATQRKQGTSACLQIAVSNFPSSSSILPQHHTGGFLVYRYVMISY